MEGSMAKCHLAWVGLGLGALRNDGESQGLGQGTQRQECQGSMMMST